MKRYWQIYFLSLIVYVILIATVMMIVQPPPVANFLISMVLGGLLPTLTALYFTRKE